MAILDDTFSIKKRNPGEIAIMINNPDDNSGILWKGDSIIIHNYSFYQFITKTDSSKKVKFAIIYELKE